MAVDGGDEGDDWGRARWRLRDLEGGDRWLVAGLFVVALVPFVVALVRGFHDGWIPSGDEANIATRALDVFSRHAPLTGLPSTSALYGDKIATNHPGPIEFYLLAVPLRVLGMSAGPLLTAATINGGCVLITLWVFFRRLGLVAMSWAAVLILLVMFSAGSAVLVDTLSSNMTMFSVLCTAVLAWALVDGDLRLLPLTAFVATYAAQQHLAAGLIVLPLLVVASAVLGWQILTRVRRGDVTVKRSALRWSGAALAVLMVGWAPVLDDQFRGHPGNLTMIVRFARDNSRPTLGLKSGVYQAVHAVAPPTVMGRTQTTGVFFQSAPGALRVLLGIAVVVALVALAWAARSRARGLARLALVALVLLAAGVVNGSNVPHSLEAGRVNLYRWSWAAAFLTWSALGIGLAFVAGRVAGEHPVVRRVRRVTPMGLLVVAALIATSTLVVHRPDDHNRELPAFAAEKRIATAVLARIDRHRPVLVAENGPDANLSIGPYVIFRLLEAGVRVQVSSFSASTYGRSRVYRPRSDPATLLISSGKAQGPTGLGSLVTVQPFGPGRTAAFDHLVATRTALLDDLSAAALGKTVELAPGTADLLKRYSPLQQFQIGYSLSYLPTYPRIALADPNFLKLVLTGRLRSPVLDRGEVLRLIRLPRAPVLGTYGDEQVEVRLVAPRSP